MTAILRSFVRHRSYGVLSALTLALAVGVNLVVFTIVNAIWLRPRAIPRADRVVMVLGHNDLSATHEGYWFAELGLDCSVRQLPVFEKAAGQVATSGDMAEFEPHIVLDRLGREVEALGVTWQYFSVIGGLRGRDFTAADDRQAAEVVGIMSDRLWRRDFSADPAIIGSTLPASPVPIRIVGIAPPGFHGVRLGERVDLWVPSKIVAQVARPGITTRREPPLLAVARLKDGISIAQAERVVNSENPCGQRGYQQGYAVAAVSDLYGGPRSRTIVTRESGALLVVAVTAGLVLIGGCATLMALVLMHYERRRQELAVRMALGCSGVRLSMQLTAELACLGIAGLAGAVAVTYWTLSALPALSFTSGVDFSRLDLSLDWRVMTTGVMATAATLVLAAMLPMRRAARTNVAAELLSSSSRNTPTSLRLRRAMLAVHSAATVTVLVAAGLFLRTVQIGFSGNAGFDLRRTLFVTAQVSSSHSEWAGSREATEAARKTLADSRAARARDLIERLSALPGVDAVTVGTSPIGLDQGARANRTIDIKVDGQVRAVPWTGTGGGPEYLSVLRVPLLAGRSLTAADVVRPEDASSERRIIVTSSFARMVWADQSAIGRRFSIGETPFEVVGVSGDFTFGSLRVNQRAGSVGARNVEQMGRSFNLTLAIGASGDASQLVKPVRAALTEVFPAAMAVDLATGRDIVSRDLGRERVGASFFTGFGLLALCLGLAGIFALVAYHAESRRRDLGIRMALGATSQVLIRETVLVGVLPVVAGTLAGLVIAAGAAGAVKASVFGVSSLDPLTYVAVGALLVGGAFVAALTAARRLGHLSPLDALRSL